MNKHIISLLATLLILAFNGLFGQNPSDQEKIEMLREFYKAYTIEVEKMGADWGKKDSIEAQYCTEKLLHWRKNTVLHYDPFINAQDLREELYKILKIYRDKSRDNKFVVTYNYFENKPEYESRIELIVIGTSGNYQIDEILID